MNALENHHLILIGLVVAVAVWKGWIPIPEFLRSRSEPSPTPPQPVPAQTPVQAETVQAPARRFRAERDMSSVIDAAPPELLGQEYIKAQREEAQRELDQDALNSLSAQIKATYKAPFSASAPPEAPTGS